MKEYETGRRVIEGFRLPGGEPATQNEHLWIAFLRLVFYDNVPAPQMKIQFARQVLCPLAGCSVCNDGEAERQDCG